MASVEFIMNRIEGAKKKIAKLESKLERIKAAEATNWEINPYYYHKDDLKWTGRDLEDAKKSLAKYEQELEEANQKAASRNVPAITEFLDNWKIRMREMYEKAFEEYPAAYAAYQEDIKPYEMDYFEERKMKRENPDKWIEIKEARDNINEAFNMRFGFIQPYIERAYDHEAFTYSLWAFDNLKLEKDLTDEYNRKYDFIIERTNKIVETITDASNLKVGAKGDLNGYIIGTKGKAKVQTIGAGGYNIQCYHFRTLINRLK